MPLPFILGAVAAKVVLGVAATTGVVGAAKGVKGVMDSNEAKGVQRRAEDIIDKAKDDIENIKENTSEHIKNLGKLKIKVCSNQINNFVSYYSKLKHVELKDSVGLDELTKLNFSQDTLAEMKDVAIGALNLMSGGLAGIGAGALLGWGTYGGVMALGTAATTGTAIGSLTGIAATNATLAWLGGGALSIGGGGMALGSAILGGLVAGPALLVAGGIFSAKAKEKLNNAYSNLAEAKKIAEELKTAGLELTVIADRANQIREVLNKISKQFDYVNKNLKEIVEHKTDWRTLTTGEKKIVAMAVKYAQVTKAIIDVPLLSEEGILTQESENILHNQQVLLLTHD